MSEWAAPNAWIPRRGRKGGVRGTLNQERGEFGGGGGQPIRVKRALSGVTCPSAKSLFVLFLPKIDHWAISAFLKSHLFKNATLSQPLQNWPQFPLGCDGAEVFTGLSLSIHTCCHVFSSDITSCTLRSSFPMTSAVTGWDCCGVSACLHLLCRPSAPVQQAQTGRQMAAPLTSEENYKLRCFFHLNSTNVPGMMAPILTGNGFPFNKTSD